MVGVCNSEVSVSMVITSARSKPPGSAVLVLTAEMIGVAEAVVDPTAVMAVEQVEA